VIKKLVRTLICFIFFVYYSGIVCLISHNTVNAQSNSASSKNPEIKYPQKVVYITSGEADYQQALLVNSKINEFLDKHIGLKKQALQDVDVQIANLNKTGQGNADAVQQALQNKPLLEAKKNKLKNQILYLEGQKFKVNKGNGNSLQANNGSNIEEKFWHQEIKYNKDPKLLLE